MRVLVTGATGKVGNATAAALLQRGDEVRALVRNPAAARNVVPAGIELVQGDVEDPESLARAAEGCELVFNAMGLPEQWFKDDSVFERVNARGTESVVRAAVQAGVRRVVHTSTIDVFEAGRGARLDESRVAVEPKGTAYERSKQLAEELALGAADGTELVIVNPAAVYGPGPSGGASFERDLFMPVISGSRAAAPALPPGGMGLVMDRDVAAGQLLAAERGRPGERYILCESHATLRELAELVVRVAGRGRVPPVLPAGVARAMAGAGEAVSRVIRKPPLLPRGQLHFFMWNAHPDSSKARKELGWDPTPLEDGIRETLEAHGLM